MRHASRATLLGFLVTPGAIVLAGACGSAEPGTEQVGRQSEAVTIVDNPTCKVEWTKIDYDQPGTDSSEFIELFVTKTGALVSTLGDCGIGAITLFESGSCLVPYRVIPLQNVTIPTDGYVVICNGAGCDVNVGTSPWLDDGPAEIGFLSATLPAAPIIWASYEGAPQCIPLATNPPKVDVKTEDGSSPNQINVWCASGFELVPEASSPKRQPNVCPAPDAGAGGNSGSSGSSGAGGTSGSSGASGSSGSSGASGSSGSSGASGSSGSSGAAGSSASGGAAGSSASGGAAGSAAAGGDAGAAASGGSAGSAATGGASGSAGLGGSAAGGSGGNGGTTASGGFGGSSANAGSAGSAGSLGLDDPSYEIQGGGSCACATPHRRSSGAPWLALVALAASVLRRRAARLAPERGLPTG